MFHYCENCRKIKNWPRANMGKETTCGVCGQVEFCHMMKDDQFTSDRTIDKCPSPCAGECRLCHIMKEGLHESDPQGLDNIIRDKMEKMKKTHVDVDNGKYTVIMTNSVWGSILRHGVFSKDTVRGSLEWCLAAELSDAREEIKLDKQRLQSMITLANAQEKEIKKLRKECEENSRPF